MFLVRPSWQEEDIALLDVDSTDGSLGEDGQGHGPLPHVEQLLPLLQMEVSPSVGSAHVEHLAPIHNLDLHLTFLEKPPTILVRDVLLKKKLLFFWILSKRGGVGVEGGVPYPNFLAPFHKFIFGQ